MTGKIPGAILLIQQHGKPVYFESFGLRDPETRQPMTPDTIFQIYSMSKAVTSVAAMMLVDDGKLSLDDPVSKYIRTFADAKVGVDISDETGQHPLKLEPLKRPITIKDLHLTAGVRTTLGSRLFENFVPDWDRPIVERLKGPARSS